MKIVIEKFKSGTIRIKVDGVTLHTYLKASLAINSRLRRFKVLRDKRLLASFPMDNSIVIHK